MKTIPFGLVICTAGHPNSFLSEIGMSQSMEKIMANVWGKQEEVTLTTWSEIRKLAQYIIRNNYLTITTGTCAYPYCSYMQISCNIFRTDFRHEFKYNPKCSCSFKFFCTFQYFLCIISINP